MDNNDSSEIIESKQGTAGVFGRAASTYDRTGPRFFSHFGRRLVDFAQIPSGARVLDIATGRGAVLFSAVKAVGPQGHVIGIDLAREMVQGNREEIERLKLQNVEVREMDAEHLEFPDGTFDYVLCSFAIFFFPQLDRALSEMVRVLKPAGRIAVTTWGTRDERWNWLDDLIKSYLSPEPPTEQTPDPQPAAKHVFDTPEGLEAILASAGFVDIKIISEAKEFTYADEVEWWSTQWSHGFRKILEAIEKKMGEDGLKKFQADAFKNLRVIKQSNGIPRTFAALFGTAFKPKI